MSETVELLRSIRDATRHMADIREHVEKKSSPDISPVQPSPENVSQPANLPVPYNRPISHPPALSGGTNVPAIRNIFSLARQQSGGESPDWGQPLQLGQSRTNLTTMPGSALGPSAMGSSVGEWRQKVNIGGGKGGGVDYDKQIVQKLDEIIAVLRESNPTPDTSTEIGAANNQSTLIQQKIKTPKPLKQPERFHMPEAFKAALWQTAIGAGIAIEDKIYQAAKDFGAWSHKQWNKLWN